MSWVVKTTPTQIQQTNHQEDTGYWGISFHFSILFCGAINTSAKVIFSVSAMVCIVSAIRILPICTVALFSLSHLNYIDALLLPFRSSVNQSVGAKHLESDINIRKSYLALNSLPSSDVDKNSKSDKESVCPFSMKYPRYRVPLSAGKEDYSAKGGNIFSGIRISLDKAAVSRKYATDVKMNNYCIVEPQIDVSEDTDRIAKGKVGIFVTSLIWRKVAELIEDHVSGRSSRSVISIPNASVVSLVQISDIINWHNKQQAEKTVNSAPVEIEACVDKEAAVPTVVLTAFEGSGEPCVKANEQTTEQIIDGTKSWVLRVLVKLGICPFTKSVTKSGQGLQDAGIPVGNIAYHHSNAGLNEIPHLMAGKFIRRQFSALFKSSNKRSSQGSPSY